MAIKIFEERQIIRPRGIIRLGTKDDGDRGKIHNTEYFVLKDAPDVQKIYGDYPAELDIVFPSNDIDKVARSDYEYWKGVRGKDGKMEGLCACRGTGPSLDGTPGTATWYDRGSAPPPEECLSPRNPATGYLERVCFGDGARGACRACVHFRDLQGKPLCKMTLRMFVVLPRVAMNEFYLITSHSYHTMNDVLSHLHLKRKMNTPINNRVFTLYKDSQAARPWDEKQQREYRTTIHVVRIKENKEFMSLYGKDVIKKIEDIAKGTIQIALPSAEDVLSLPPPAFESDVLNEMDEAQNPKLVAAEILKDKEVSEAFELLEKLNGKEFSEKSKLVAISKKIGAPDVKAAVLEELDKRIQAAREKTLADKEEPQEASPDAMTAQEDTPLTIDEPVAPEVESAVQSTSEESPSETIPEA